MEGVGGIHGWKWIFLIPGLVTIVLAIPIFFFIADFPEKSSWLKEEELELVRNRLKADRGEVLEEKASKEALWAVATDWKVYVMASLLMLPTAGSYSLAFFVPSILSSLGFSVALSQILTTPPYFFSALVSIATGIIADRVKMRTPFIVGYSLLVMVGLVLIGWGPNTAAKMTGIFFAVTGNNCAIPSALALLANNIVGTSKRQFAVPIQTIFGGIGGIIGSLIFRPQDHPHYRPGLYASLGCMTLNIALTCILASHFYLQNRKAETMKRTLEGLPGFKYTI